MGSASQPYDILTNSEHLRGVKFEDLPNKKVGLLIGINAAFVFRPLESGFGSTGFSSAAKTLLGWVLFHPKWSHLYVGHREIGLPVLALYTSCGGAA